MLIIFILQVSLGMISFPLKQKNELKQSLLNETLNTHYTYQTNLCLNTTGRNLSFSVDTTSSWLVISQAALMDENPECESEKKELSLKGKQVEGKICKIKINFGENVNNVHFFMSDAEFINADGILGLGFSRLSDGYLPIVQQIEENIFSLYLSKSSNTSSVLTIGGYSSDYGSEKVSDISSYPHLGYWEFSIENIKISNETLNIYSFGILDSSEQKLIFPEKVFKFVFDKLSEQLKCGGLEYIKCNVTGFNITNLPNISLSIQGSEFVLKASTFSHCSEEECEFYLASHSEDKIVVGISFFQEFYLVFDMEQFVIQAYMSSDHAVSGAYYTLYIIGVIVFGVIVSIPLCFWMMLSKIKGVADLSPEYQKLTN